MTSSVHNERNEAAEGLPPKKVGGSANGGSWFRQPRLSLLSILGVFAVAVGIIGGFHLWWHLNRTTVAEVESMVSQNLSPGATTEEIFAFLDSRDIDYGSVGRVDGTSYLLDAGFDPHTKVIGAFIYGTSRNLIITGDIQIFFILEEDERLKEYLVREVFTGP